MTDHKQYILNTLSRAIEQASESRAKTSNPKAWKAIKEASPTWPIYDSNTMPYEVLTAWDVAKRVAIDDLVKQLLKPAPTPTNPEGNQADAPAPLKSVADA